jgi:hypothetical protein
VQAERIALAAGFVAGGERGERAKSRLKEQRAPPRAYLRARTGGHRLCEHGLERDYGPNISTRLRGGASSPSFRRRARLVK